MTAPDLPHDKVTIRPKPQLPSLDEIAEMRKALDGVPNGPWRYGNEDGYSLNRVWSSTDQEMRIDIWGDSAKADATMEHIARYDPPTVSRLLSAAQELAELRAWIVSGEMHEWLTNYLAHCHNKTRYAPEHEAREIIVRLASQPKE